MSSPSLPSSKFQQATSEIISSLASYRSEVDSWVAQKENKVTQDQQSHQNAITLQQESIVTLSNTEKKLIEEAKRLELVLKKEAEEQAKLQNDLQSLQARAQALPPVIQNEKGELQRLTEEILQKRAVIEKLEAEQTLLYRQYYGRSKFYKERLGMRFEKPEGYLKVIFTNIDPQNPSREFYFLTYVDANSRYHISEHSPILSDIDSLVDQLNKDNNFSRFVITIRKKFVSSVKSLA